MEYRDLIDGLDREGALSHDEFVLLVKNSADNAKYAASKASAISRTYFGNKIFIRGLIEVSNYCKNDCFYCGIRKSNEKLSRYRLSEEQIYSCCERGHKLGFRTFVLQGGEDLFFTDEKIAGIVSNIKKRFPDCAVTLSLGEKSFDSYKLFFDSGADRYLLRHETADISHYKKMHPSEMSPENRYKCLQNLKDIGYQTGCGFMVGSPFQTCDNIADDLLFIQKLKPQMVGIGPFIPQKDTPFKDFSAGSSELTIFLLSLVRIMLKNVLLPATTALGTALPKGRERGILAGANVVMPNLSPIEARKRYLIYDNKLNTDVEAEESLKSLAKNLKDIGYEIATSRGDWKRR